MTTHRRELVLVFSLALLLRALAALPQTQPNYMDAAYYLVGGQQVAQGYGFNDPYVWHYLDAPTTLPHPSHLYWMPLPSILVAISQSVFGVNFRAAQLPFVVLAAVLPVIAYGVAWQLSGRRRHAWLAALFTLVSPFYLAYWGVPESFAPFAVFGALAMWLGSRSGGWETRTQAILTALAAGACVGLAHLSRADGFLLLLPSVVGAFNFARHSPFVTRQAIRQIGLILLGYLLIMTPWFLRNLSVIGAPLASAGTQTAFMCRYDELFTLDAQFEMSHLLGCGLENVVAVRLNAVLSGAVHVLAEGGMIFLAPLMALGWWVKRRERVMRGALIYLAFLFGVMTLVFPFVGDRGGLFHSMSALLPFFYAAAALGLDAFIGWVAARRRAWRVGPAQRVFSAALIVLAVALAGVIYRGRVLGVVGPDAAWNQADRTYAAIGRWLADRGVEDPIVVVNSPPNFTYQTQLRSIVIPFGDEADLIAAAQRFGAEWVVLDANRPEPLARLYAAPERDPRFRVAALIEGAQVLQVIAP